MSEETLIEDALRRLENMLPIVLDLDPLTAWAVLGNLQLALRHPGNRGGSTKIVLTVARAIQQALADHDPELGRLAERGFHEVFDVPSAPQPKVR